MEIIFLPKPTSNTSWQNLKIHVLTLSTNLQEFSFLPQPLLAPLYLWCASLPDRQCLMVVETHFPSLDRHFSSISHLSLLASSRASKASTPLVYSPCDPRHKWARADVGKPRMPAKVVLWSAW